ncbi:MAG: acetyl-CoA hydrolase/transferase family protein [Candidatus Eremiobacteraeota bacterium]|nr:acetyl-CoA hydrolase/transferase family protein [Candidatus Eremiobacteraeota bacterium]
MSWKDQAVTPAQAVAQVKSHDKVFLHGAAAAPLTLEAALCQRQELEGVHLYHIHVEGKAPFAEPEHKGRFSSYSFFTGPNLRQAVSEGRADFIPVFLSDIPLLFRSGRVPLDVALVSLSWPDKHGFCSLGPSVEAALEAVRTAKLVIAEINPRMPRTHGDSFVHLDQVDHFCLVDRALPTHDPPPIGPVEQAIGDQIAAMIQDGNTLQLGIGAIPAAVVSQLGDKNDLGIHTEMFTDGVVELMLSGVINNSRKTTHAGHSVTSFVSGSQRLFDFINDNPAVEFYGCDYTNNVGLIAEHDHMVAVNSALEVDLTGQVAADSIGPSFYSGVGGQVDFVRGAARSRGGKPIIALSATAKDGALSRIVSLLKPGAGVTTSRNDVHYVVTEYGVAELYGRSVRQRALALINIAAPQFREELMVQAKELHYL